MQVVTSMDGEVIITVFLATHAGNQLNRGRLDYFDRKCLRGVEVRDEPESIDL